MSKNFLPRISKKGRDKIELDGTLLDRLKVSDEKLLKGAQLMDVDLSKITLREQVRTKFNDESLKELSENIRINGLIQPLVIHREGDQFVLLCGERRFRAMQLIQFQKAPCFILEGKTKEELMAIQFSENTSREELHYVDKADGIYNYHMATQSSERKIQDALGIPKTEVHRGLIIAKLPQDIKAAAKVHNMEKYLLLEISDLFQDLEVEKQKKITELVVNGSIVKRTDFKKILQLFPDLAAKKAAKKATKKGPPTTKRKKISLHEMNL